VRGFDAALAGQLETVRGRIDADHPARLDHVAAQQFVQQVGSDVAGSDDGGGDLAGHHISPIR
jgi:hypothetical protein